MKRSSFLKKLLFGTGAAIVSDPLKSIASGKFDLYKSSYPETMKELTSTSQEHTITTCSGMSIADFDDVGAKEYLSDNSV